MEGRRRTENHWGIWGKCQCWYREIYLPLSSADIFSLKTFFTFGSGLDICLSFGICVFQDSHFAQTDCAFKCLTFKFFFPPRWRTNLRKHIDFSIWQRFLKAVRLKGINASRIWMVTKHLAETWYWYKRYSFLPSCENFLMFGSLPMYEKPVCM